MRVQNEKKIFIIICAVIFLVAIAFIVYVNIDWSKIGHKNCFDYNFEYIELTRQDGSVVRIEGEEADKIRAEFSKKLSTTEMFGDSHEYPIEMRFKKGWGHVNVSLDSCQWMMAEDYANGYTNYRLIDSTIHDYLVSLYLGEEATLS